MSKKKPKNSWVMCDENGLHDMDEFKKQIMNEMEQMPLKPELVEVSELQNNKLSTLPEETSEAVKEIEDEVKKIEDMSDEELKTEYVKRLKESKKRKSPIVHKGNVTVNPYGDKFKAKRKNKKKTSKASRKANR